MIFNFDTASIQETVKKCIGRKYITREINKKYIQSRPTIWSETWRKANHQLPVDVWKGFMLVNKGTSFCYDIRLLVVVKWFNPDTTDKELPGVELCHTVRDSFVLQCVSIHFLSATCNVEALCWQEVNRERATYWTEPELVIQIPIKVIFY